MRHKIIAGNWKMHGSREQNSLLVSSIAAASHALSHVRLVLFPPFVYLDHVARLITQTPVGLGAQNVSQYDCGAYTGEIAASMLRDCGCDYVIVGHSERRQLFNETSASVAQKVLAALNAGLTPILCVGEMLTERERGLTESVVAAQLQSVVECVGAANVARIVVAYEPVWAIGTGKAATPEQVEVVHAFIRAFLASVDRVHGESVSILYGGSVKPDNAASFFARPCVDGVLIGGASLSAPDFLAIAHAT